MSLASLGQGKSASTPPTSNKLGAGVRGMVGQYDEICGRCSGTGVNFQEEACTFCEGWGYHLTDKGHDLVEFLKRRGFSQSMSPQAEEELRGTIE